METEKNEFAQFKLNKQILDAIQEAGYQNPTPIQQKAIPAILAGQDIFGIAQTGTGKTAAYLLPLLMKLKFGQGQHPRCIILAPTRELVMQIFEQFKVFAKNTDLRAVCLYGGIGAKTQIEQIKEGADVIISTTGRLLEIYHKEVLFLREINTMILDEADKMMDMGFMPQIRQVLEIIPKKRQNLLFSATMPQKVLQLSEEFLEFPLTVEVAPQATPTDTIEQRLYFVPNFQTKLNLLDYFFQYDNFNRVIIFTKTKTQATKVFNYFQEKRLGKVRVIHGNKGQNSRINAMQDFKDGDVRILVATDVSARGIDISQVSHVVNFDLPLVYEDYVHRIGRTGRANQQGVAISFCVESEKYHLKKIQKIIRMNIPVYDVPAEVEIVPTPFEEYQDMMREIDRQKRKENPDFQGAFHEKKPKKISNKNTKKPKKK